MAPGSGASDSGEIDFGLRSEIQSEKRDNDEASEQTGGAEYDASDTGKGIAEAVR
jgi:hypothetical protein